MIPSDNRKALAERGAPTPVAGAPPPKLFNRVVRYISPISPLYLPYISPMSPKLFNRVVRLGVRVRVSVNPSPNSLTLTLTLTTA